MQDTSYMDTGANEMASQAYLQQLKATFEQLPNEIPLYLFAAKEHDDVFTHANRQVIRAFRELSSKITLREYDLDHDLAKKWNVTHSPTLLIAPEKYSIQWLGAPMGEEARTFLEILILIGLGKSQLSEQSLKVIKRIDSARQIKIFVSPTCPYCPQQAINAVKAAIELPDRVSLEIVDIQSEPELADQYSAQSVPQAFANDCRTGCPWRSGGNHPDR
jgi:thioredoxin reductase (NADPH)